MIPHIIHYCWFGKGPLPELAEQCIASWRKYMPDWQYMRWDETNFSIADAPAYVHEAYAAKKYAFVSDYVRLWALQQYGGVYLDTDVETLKSLEPMLNDTVFMSFEESKEHLPATCVIGCEAHSLWTEDMLALYDGVSFIKPDGSLDMTTNVQRMGKVMVAELMSEEKYWKQNHFISKWGLRIYTHDYFSPITSTRVMRRTKNTYAIHHFAGSWQDDKPLARWRNWAITREIVNVLVMIKRRISK